ncbi:MAG: hypothetical protein HQ541_05280 [Mariniphaga sp.]|nr:hypothetical protein [Mariniphaga sp.]
MPEAKFYHIHIIPNEGVTKKDIQKKIELSLDWFKYGKSVWIIYSNSDVKKLWVRYKPLITPGGNLFICELNVNNRNGWMNKAFWNWLQKPRKPYLGE